MFLSSSCICTGCVLAAFPEVKLVFYHGGYISEGPNKAYVGGNVSPILVDSDVLSAFEMKALTKELGCPEICEVYHKAPSQTMDEGLLYLTGNKAIVEMVEMHGDVIDLYVHDPLLMPSQTSTQEVSSSTKDDGLRVDNYETLDEGLILEGLVEVESGHNESEVELESGDDSDYSDHSNFSGFEESSSDDEVEQMVNHMVITEPQMEIADEEGELSDKSDELQCIDNEEDDDLGGHRRKQKFREIDEGRDMEKPTLVDGMIFSNVIAFRKFLKEYHIREGYEYEKYTNKLATHRWIANKYKDTLVAEPYKKVKTLKNDVKREWMLYVSKKKVWRAKRTALEVIHGNLKEQYSVLWDYCDVLRKYNPGTHAKGLIEAFKKVGGGTRSGGTRGGGTRGGGSKGGGTRGGGSTGVGTRGGGTRGAGTTSTSKSKAKAVDPPLQERALRRLKKVGEG
ncbi:hypothetical protein Vadar_034329 [Vaccinium darrowii]|uniref:Uncharacterized protein n=1 Tax=Vaccinium darrowii TaxID=229202 RepID=A0ACB7X6T5_9ERIC|nr:hypothetical protein Vadar_034329 [Vaccinium darrowii]